MKKTQAAAQQAANNGVAAVTNAGATPANETNASHQGNQTAPQGEPTDQHPVQFDMDEGSMEGMQAEIARLTSELEEQKALAARNDEMAKINWELYLSVGKQRELQQVRMEQEIAVLKGRESHWQQLADTQYQKYLQAAALVNGGAATTFEALPEVVQETLLAVDYLRNYVGFNELGELLKDAMRVFIPSEIYGTADQVQRESMYWDFEQVREFCGRLAVLFEHPHDKKLTPDAFIFRDFLKAE